MTRHFLRDDDLTTDEQIAILDLADEFRADRFHARPLAGPQSVAVMFDKASTRTRVSFCVGISELGGYPLVIDAQSTHMGRGEPIEDTARVLDRQVQAIVWRTFGQDRIESMAAASRVPVVNGLTDLFHPCQILADLQTVRMHKRRLAGLTMSYLGDGANNMSHSCLLGGAVAGMHVRVGSPTGYEPDPRILARAAEIASDTGGSVSHETTLKAAVEGTDVVVTDTWVSMGQEAESDERSSPFVPFAVDADAMALADPEAVVLHCLPAYRGKEISADVVDGPQSLVWDEAENRLHVQKALLTWLLDDARKR
ncbi:MAG: ornithine carbamoyltransferase [Actinomycetota bacterium]|nr:ornithine carbamoyltransferase [Actinomycetota bacterium]